MVDFFQQKTTTKTNRKAHVRHATKSCKFVTCNFVARQSCLSDIASCPTFDKSSN